MYIQLFLILTLSHISAYILNSSLFNIFFFFNEFSSFLHVLSRFFPQGFKSNCSFWNTWFALQIFYFAFQFFLHDFTLCAYSVYQTVLGIFRQLVSRHLITIKDIRKCCKILYKKKLLIRRSRAAELQQMLPKDCSFQLQCITNLRGKQPQN